MKRKIRRIHVDIDIEGRAVAAADVEQHDEAGVVRAALHVESGVPPPGRRARLVDTILDLPEVHTQRRLEAALPIGETCVSDVTACRPVRRARHAWWTPT